METTSPWPSALRYGLILAFVQIIINLVFYIINPETAQNSMSVLGVTQMLLVAVLSIYLLYHGTIKRRDEDLGGTITYNKSLGFMLRMALPAAFVVSVYTFIFLKYINSDMMEKAMEIQAQEMYNKGMSEEQIDQAMGMAKKMTSPAAVTVMSMFGSMIIFFIYALIASIFTKKVPVTDNN
jgi:hypothetical protein